MNHKTIRAYQFKADEAVRTLEEAGAQWVVGKGKPHWVLPIEPKVDVEGITKQARKEFLEEIMSIGKSKDVPVSAVPVVDSFELGPQVFPNRQQYIHKFAMIHKIPSWHKLGMRYAGSMIQVHDIAFISRSHYKGYCVVFKIGDATAWLPLSCIEFKL